MTVPQNIRFNLNAPFPSLVTGSGPITVGKQNGIWTVGYGVAQIGQQAPIPAQFLTDYVLVWDSITQSFAQVSIANINRYNRLMAGYAAVNFNAGNTDTSISISVPTAAYKFSQVMFSGASASLAAATWGLFSAAAGGGTAIFAAGQTTTVTTGTANAANNLQAATSASSNTQAFNFTNLFFRIGTASTVPATATVSLWVDPLPP